MANEYMHKNSHIYTTHRRKERGGGGGGRETGGSQVQDPCGQAEF